jgi:phosphopantetheinyl transferase (holo-ACP synthase)
VAAEAVHDLQIGIALEKIRQLEAEFTEAGFHTDELTLLGSLPEELRDQWILRLWCAKEAVAKTLGDAPGGSENSYILRKVDVGSGRVEVDVRRSVDGSDSNPNPLRVMASTDSSDGYVVALSTQLGS